MRFGLGLQAAVLRCGIVLVGFPHGAFKHLLARPILAPRLGPLWWAPFGLAYIGLAGRYDSRGPSRRSRPWRCSSPSVLHFGLGDFEDGLAPRDVPQSAAALAYGAMPVLLPMDFHPSDAAPVLAALGWVSEPAIAAALARTAWLVPLWLAAFAWVGRAVRPADSGAAAPAVEAAGFVLLPPLLAFGLYFGLVHSPRHLLRLGAWHDPHDPRRAARWAAWTFVPAGVACALGLLGFAVAAQDANGLSRVTRVCMRATSAAVGKSRKMKP